MPGMIDTHRHMWQTALRGYGGDWALSQYFVFYYLQHGQVFRPEDIYAGNLLSALESVDTGVTTTLDWSHALRTPDYAEAALQAFARDPGPFRARLRQLPRGRLGLDEHARVRSVRRAALLEPDRHARPADRLRRDRRRGLPGAGRLREGARHGAARHDPRRGVGRDDRHRHRADVRRRLHDARDHLRARRDPQARELPEDRRDRGHRSRSPARASRARVRGIRRPGSCASTASPPRCRWTRASGGAPTSSRPCAPR